MLMQVKVLRKAKVLLTARMKTKARVKSMVKAETKAMMKTTVKDDKEKDNHEKTKKNDDYGRKGGSSPPARGISLPHLGPVAGTPTVTRISAEPLMKVAVGGSSLVLDMVEGACHSPLGAEPSTAWRAGSWRSCTSQ